MWRVRKSGLAKDWQIRFLVTVYLVCLSPGLMAEGDGARVFGVMPVGINVLAFDLLSIQDANRAFDPNLVTPFAKYDTNLGTVQYIRTMQIKGRFVAMFGILRGGQTRRKLAGNVQIDSSNGLIDLFIGALINLKGLPPMSREEFQQFEPRTVFHLLLGASLPLGEYDRSNVVNLGSNRYTFRIGLPVIHTISWGKGNRTSWEITPSIFFFTENKDRQLKQDPMFKLETHLTHDLGERVWGAVGLFYSNGGATRVRGLPAGGRQESLGGSISLGMDFSARWGMDFRYGDSLAQNENGLEGSLYHLKLKHRF